MSKLVTRCPACEGDLAATRLTCAGCGVQLEGQFEIPALLRLSPEELEFVTAFVRASGSLKEMARLEKQSYPTIRARLDELIAKLDADRSGAARTQNEILDAIARGTMTAAEGAARLKEIKS